MNGERLYTGVLQPFRHFLDINRLLIPAQSCFDGYRKAGCFHASFGEPDHELQIFQYARTCTFVYDPLDRTAEIDVYKIRLHLVNNGRGHRHRFFIAAVELNADGSFLRQDLDFLFGLIGTLNEAMTRDKFSVQEIRAVCLAEHAKRRITHILHGRK